MKKIIKGTGILLIVFACFMTSLSCSQIKGKDGKVKVAPNNSYIVDINAKTSTNKNPVSVELKAGTYIVTVIGVSEGGAYDAWKPWFHKEIKNFEGKWIIGWINKYSYSSSAFPEKTIFDDIIYGTPALALANAEDSKFTLKNKALVNFYINDSPYFDNKGGISLNIIPVSD